MRIHIIPVLALWNDICKIRLLSIALNILKKIVISLCRLLWVPRLFLWKCSNWCTLQFTLEAAFVSCVWWPSSSLMCRVLGMWQSWVISLWDCFSPGEILTCPYGVIYSNILILRNIESSCSNINHAHKSLWKILIGNTLEVKTLYTKTDFNGKIKIKNQEMEDFFDDLICLTYVGYSRQKIILRD